MACLRKKKRKEKLKGMRGEEQKNSINGHVKYKLVLI